MNCNNCDIELPENTEEWKKVCRDCFRQSKGYSKCDSCDLHVIKNKKYKTCFVCFNKTKQ